MNNFDEEIALHIFTALHVLFTQEGSDAFTNQDVKNFMKDVMMVETSTGTISDYRQALLEGTLRMALFNFSIPPINIYRITARDTWNHEPVSMTVHAPSEEVAIERAGFSIEGEQNPDYDRVEIRFLSEMKAEAEKDEGINTTWTCAAHPNTSVEVRGNSYYCPECKKIPAEMTSSMPFMHQPEKPFGSPSANWTENQADQDFMQSADFTPTSLND